MDKGQFDQVLLYEMDVIRWTCKFWEAISTIFSLKVGQRKKKIKEDKAKIDLEA